MSDQDSTPAIPKPAGPHRWQKGQPSANPKGRPRTGLALAERIRERMSPDTLIDLAARVAADETLSPERRLEILIPLYDRGFLKPPIGVAAQVETTSTVQRDWAALALDDRRQLLERIRGVPTVALVGGRDQNPTILDGDPVLSPTVVAIAAVVSDEESKK